jgi:hypothetical protein
MQDFKEIFNIATKIHTPLMLGGVIVFVLFFIFYKIVSSLPLGKTDPKNTTLVLIKLMRFIWILALVGIGLGFFAYIGKIILETRYPALSPTYVDVGTDAVYPLEGIVRTVARNRNVTIYFDNACDSTIRKAPIGAGNHNGKDIQDFLEKLKDRVEGKSVSFSIKKEGESRYEITCP